MFQVFPKFLLPLYEKINDDEIFTRSAAVAYAAALSFAPTIILVASFLGILRINLVQSISEQADSIFGYGTGEWILKLADYSKDNVQFASLSGIIGIGILLFSGSLFFRQLELTMDFIFREFRKPTKQNRKYYQEVGAVVKDRIVTILVFLVGAIFAIVSLLASFFLNSALMQYSPMIYEIVFQGFSLLVFSFLFFMLFLCTPARRISKGIILLGSFLTSALFLIGKEIIAWYIAGAGIGSIYGAAGTIVVFLIWFYYSSLTVFLGAEAISVLARPAKP